MNFYQYLNVPPNASENEIKKAFRKLAKMKHPDHNPKESAFWEMVELNVIRDTLLNEEKRQNYDRSLLAGSREESAIQSEPVSHRHATNVYRSVKSFFTYRCRVCGVEMKSTWRGYCLLHYLEATNQLDNPEFIFEYAGQKYKWADPPEQEHPGESVSNTGTIKVTPLYLIAYTTFIVILTICTIIMARQFFFTN